MGPWTPSSQSRKLVSSYLEALVGSNRNSCTQDRAERGLAYISLVGEVGGLAGHKPSAVSLLVGIKAALRLSAEVTRLHHVLQIGGRRESRLPELAVQRTQDFVSRVQSD